MTKLSELKVGDRFTIECRLSGVKNNLYSFVLPGRNEPFMFLLDYGDPIVTKLPDLPRPLKTGERIKGLMGHRGTFLCETDAKDSTIFPHGTIGWVKWDEVDYPKVLNMPPTTEFYDVVED